MLTIAAIQRRVAKEYRVPYRIMREPDGLGSRAPHDSHPRQLAMALAALLSEHSLARIGHYFGGRHHTTVLYAVRVIHQRRCTDKRRGPKIQRTMRRLALEMMSGGGATA